ncbi:hypothetical protein AB0B89_29135 [Sphaerisporangium sp. NPDC049002]|uniref:hypothetical protein n=1 Tax=unclassified Sphaerisporangium TaxID=2630420 RepID=UPI0033E95D0F
MTMRRAGGNTAPNSPVDGIRILALLPRHWHKDLRHVLGHIAIRVHIDEDTTDTRIRAQVAAILTHPEAGDWELATLHTLAGGRHGPPRPLREAAGPYEDRQIQFSSLARSAA